jgi:hypothetical protein
MSKCKYNYNSIMGKTRKNAKPRKDKTKDLEDLIDGDLIEEDLDLSDTESESDSGSDTGSDSETSMSKELNKMINETMDSDMTMPAIGIGLLAIIGFALYKGINVNA